MSETESTTKICVKCGTEKPISEFYRRSNGKVHAECKLCFRARPRSGSQKQATPADERKPSPPSERDAAILLMLSEGKAFSEIGRQYGISRQRVKQIAVRLEHNGLLVSDPRGVRRARAAVATREALSSRFGDSYEKIVGNPALLASLRKRLAVKAGNARARGIPFDLTVSDLFPLPEFCPVLGIPIAYGHASGGPIDQALSIDRIDPAKGYTKDNIILVSLRANRIKTDATPIEIKKVADFYTSLELERDLARLLTD